MFIVSSSQIWLAVSNWSACSLAFLMIVETKAVMISAIATIARPIRAFMMMVLDFRIFSVEPAEVLYEIPPYTIKIADTMPAIAMNQCRVFRNSVVGSIQLLLIQSTSVPLLPPFSRIARIVPMIAADDIVMARPIKACFRVFFPAAALDGSSPERTYWYPPYIT